MAVYKIFPKKDATLYSDYPNLNTGLDEILEVGAYEEDNKTQLKRSLLQFSSKEIKYVRDTLIGNSNYQSSLKLKIANSSNLPTLFKLEVYPLYEEWANGNGKFDDQKTNTGVDWQTTDSFNSWDIPTTSSEITSSFYDLNEGGGVWYTSFEGTNISSSEEFNYNSNLDTNLDTTSAVELFYSRSISVPTPSGSFLPNNGFIVKLEDSYEDNVGYNIDLKYFSSNTNTIYPPSLEFKWDDSNFNTGSSTHEVLTDPESFISIFNNRGEYYLDDVARFRVAATPKYPQRIFTTSSLFNENYYLPEAKSFYAIKDSFTNEYVIDFDQSYTHISADEKSSYFDIYMQGLEPERYYTILIKTELDGVIKTFDQDILFKITNG